MVAESRVHDAGVRRLTYTLAPKVAERASPRPKPRRRTLQQPSCPEKVTGPHDEQRQEPSHSIEKDSKTFMRKWQRPRSQNASAWSRFPHNGYGTWVGISLFSLFLSACGPALYWAKPDAAEGEFEQDLRSCREILINEVQYTETSLNPFSRGITDDALAQCMNSQGWFLAEKP